MPAVRTHALNILIRRRSVLVVFVVGAILSLFAGFAARRHESEHVAEQFAADAESQVYLLRRSLNDVQSRLAVVAAFFDYSDNVTREEFGGFTRRLGAGSAGVSALGFAPRVPAAERQAFESAVRRTEWGSFQLTERIAAGEPIAAAPHTDYFPVRFIEPADGNETALGHDAASDATQAAALAAARDSGQAAISAPPSFAPGQATPLRRSNFPHYEYCSVAGRSSGCSATRWSAGTTNRISGSITCIRKTASASLRQALRPSLHAAHARLNIA